MKKNTILEFFDVLTSKITNCFLPKNTLSKLDSTQSNERSSNDFLSRLWPSCWSKTLRMSVMLGAIMMMGYTVTAQNIKGIVPVQYPASGSGVDGDAWAHEPIGSKFITVGDLFDKLYIPGGGAYDPTNPTVTHNVNHGLIDPTTGKVLFPPSDPSIAQTIPVTYQIKDNYLNDKTIFTSSNKINDNPKTYTWGPGTSPNKNEIQNCGAHFSYGDPQILGGVTDASGNFISPTPSGVAGSATDLWCLFAGDRQTINGSSYIDFEFLQASLKITGANYGPVDPFTGVAAIESGSGGFTTDAPDATGGRTPGDILITIEFTQGGGDATVVIRTWQLVGSIYEYVVIPNTTFPGFIFCTNNDVTTTVPFDVYGSGVPGTYAPNQWAEGAINLTKVFEFINKPCVNISTLFIRTRSSGSSSQSELKDFPGAPIQLNLDLTPKATAVATPAPCFGGTGSIDLTVTGGKTPYTFAWTGPNGFTASTEDLPSVPAGVYNVTITDAKSCSITASATVTQPASAVTATDAHTNVLCYGGNTGSVTLTFSGGTAPYQVSFNGGAFATQTSPAVYSNLIAGDYAWIVKDANGSTGGCTASGTETVGQPAAAVTATDAHTNVLCYGGNTGSVTLTFSGGTAPYQVSFNGGAFATQTSPAVYSNLIAGDYAWIVKDANGSTGGCTASGTETVTQPDAAVTATDAHTNVLCYGGNTGSVTLTFSGGTAPYQVSFNGGAFATQTSPAVYSNLIAGDYAWIVKDANGSTGGCTTSGSETVGQPASAVMATDAHTNVLCFGGNTGSVTLTFSGGTAPYQVSFNGGAFATQTSPAVYNNLIAGDYAWIVKDANGSTGGCTASGSETVTQPAAAVIATDAHTNVLCYGGNTGSVTLTFSGGTAPYQVSFNGGAFATQTSPVVYSNLIAGTYNWIVKDANNTNSGCSASGSETVTQPAAAVTATDAHTNVLCYGGNTGSVTLTFSGGTAPYQVSFNGGAFAPQTSPAVYSNLIAGDYAWIVKDANGSTGGCTASGTETVGQPASAVTATDAHTNVLCYGGNTGSVTLTFSGGTAPYQVSFNGGAFAPQTSPAIYSNLIAGDYAWIVKDANGSTGGCTASGTETVTQPAAAVTATDAHTNVLCYGGNTGSVTLTFSGGTAPYQVSFNGGAFATQTSPAVYSNLIAGDYAWIVKDANNTNSGCSASGSETVTQPAAAVTATDAHTNVLCYGGNTGSVTLTFSGGTAPYQVSFNGGAFAPQTSPAVYSNLIAGDYAWIVKDANGSTGGCTASGSETVAQPTAVSLDLTAIAEKCAGTASGSVTASFSGGTGPYMVKIDAGSYSSATSPYTFMNLSSGLHTVTVKDANNCEISKQITVDLILCVKSLCTYTQGYYGNLGGMSCAPDDGGIFGKYTTLELIERALSSYSGGTMTIGSSGNTVVITNTPADRMAIIDVLPGGGGSYVLSGAYSISSLPSSYLAKNGRINNTLLAQTITLGLNIGINGALGDFTLQGGTLVTAAAEGGCGSDIPKERECIYDQFGNLTSVINEYQYYSISPNVVAAITGAKTVQGLFDLANTALGGGSTNGLLLSDIASAVDAINNAFDGCRIFMGYDIPKCDETSTAGISSIDAKMETAGFDAYPVPFKDVLTIKYNFDYVSDVKIEVFNSTGKSVLSKADTNSYLNKEVALNLKMNRGQEQVYVVKVTTNRGSSVKKVMSSK
jgi:hypothetical protein